MWKLGGGSPKTKNNQLQAEELIRQLNALPVTAVPMHPCTYIQCSKIQAEKNIHTKCF